MKVRGLDLIRGFAHSRMNVTCLSSTKFVGISKLMNTGAVLGMIENYSVKRRHGVGMCETFVVAGVSYFQFVGSSQLASPRLEMT